LYFTLFALVSLLAAFGLPAASGFYSVPLPSCFIAARLLGFFTIPWRFIVSRLGFTAAS
jgi:hypothetical protein